MKPGVASVVLAVIFLGVGAPARAIVRSVFIGINSYASLPGDKNAVPPLDGPANDVGIIKTALAKYYRVETGPAVTDGCVESPLAITLIGTCATRDTILAAIDGQIARAASGDTIIVFFAGHGAHVPNTYRKAGQDGDNSTLLPYDARAGVSRDIYDVEIRDRLFTANARGINVVTIFDSCSSGTANRDLRSTATARAAPETETPPPPDVGLVPNRPIDNAYLVHFAAVADGGVAVEARFGTDDALAPAPQTNGVFTRALAMALAQNPGRSTYRDIAERTRWRMAQLGAAAPPVLSRAPPGPAVAQRLDQVAPPMLKAQAARAEGALDTVFLGGGTPAARVYAALLTSPATLSVPADGLLAGLTRGSRYAIHCSLAAAGAARDALAVEAVVTAVTPSTAELQASGSVQGCDASMPLGIRETHHSFGGLRLAIGLSAGATPAETALFATALEGADALVRDDAAAAYYLGISDGSDRCNPGDGARTGAFRAAGDGRLILCLGATDTPVFERRLGDIVRAAANYHAVLALASEPTATLGEVILRDPECETADKACNFITGGDNRVATGGRVAVDVAATDRKIHGYTLLLDGRNFRVQPLNGADNADSVPIEPDGSRTLFDGKFGAAGELALLVLVTPTPLSLAALRQQPVRAAGGPPPGALERLLVSAGQGQRNVPSPAPEAWDARLTRFTIGDRR